MDVRAVTFLSSFLLVIKGNLCQSVSANSLSLSSSIGQSQLNQFTVPAVIKPIVTFDSSNLGPPNIPNYSGPSLSCQQPPLPIIIDNVSSSGNSNSLSSLLLLMFALNNNKKGGGGNCGGCNGGSCNGGSCNCGGCNCNGCNNCGGGGPYPYPGPYPGPYVGPDYFDPYNPGPVIPIDPYSSVPVTEITINGGGYIEETIVDDPLYPYPYPTIQASPGLGPNELILTIRTDYGSSC